MDTLDAAIAQFNAHAKEKGWLQICDPANGFVTRECDDLIALWEWARGDRDMPMRDDLPVRTLKPHLPRLAIAELVAHDPPQFKFRIVGTYITRTLGERTGQTFDHESATTEQTERWTESSLLTLRAKKPLRFPVVIRGAVVGEMLSMPLADADGEPRFVLAYGRYEPARNWDVPESRVRATA